MDYTQEDGIRMTREYRQRFGFRLRTRVAALLHRHPDVVSPNFLSWEGETLTGADTTDKLRALLRVCPQSW